MAHAKELTLFHFIIIIAGIVTLRRCQQHIRDALSAVRVSGIPHNTCPLLLLILRNAFVAAAYLVTQRALPEG